MAASDIPPSRHRGRVFIGDDDDYAFEIAAPVLVDIFESGLPYEINSELDTLVDAYEAEEIPTEKLRSLSVFIRAFMGTHLELSAGARSAMEQLATAALSAAERGVSLTLDF